METVNLEALTPLGLAVGFPHLVLVFIIGYVLRRRGVRVVMQAFALYLLGLGVIGAAGYLFEAWPLLRGLVT